MPPWDALPGVTRSDIGITRTRSAEHDSPDRRHTLHFLLAEPCAVSGADLSRWTCTLRR